MIGKISKGATFHGCVKYAMGKDEAKLLVAEGILIGTVKEISDSFEMQRAMRPTIKQPVGHIALSYKPEDAPRLTDKVMVGLAHEYMKEMGIKNTQYIIVCHHNTDNPHVHLIYNKVDFDGKLISSHNDFKRNEIATKKIKEKYSLTFGEGKEQVNRQKLNDPDKTKYDIYHAVKGALKTARNWNEFQQQLNRQGIEMEFKYKGQTSEVQGVRFVKDGLSYKGSQVDRAFSFSKLDTQLSQANHQEQPKQIFTPQSSQQQFNKQGISSEFTIGGLFDIPFIPNGTDPEEEASRKRMQRKKKKGIRR